MSKSLEALDCGASELMKYCPCRPRSATWSSIIISVSVLFAARVLRPKAEGPDTRDSITNILYRFLARSKILTFRDDEELRKGEGIWPNLVKAIGQSKISVTIFSPRYAESKWCLKELAEIIEHKKREQGHIILPIFYMVDPRDVRHQSGTYGVAFQQHERNGFDEETIWKAALTETDELVEIDDQVKEVVDMLDLDSQGMKVAGLHGMGGIGKTTLATTIYNKVSACFDRIDSVGSLVEAKKIIRERVTQFKILAVLDDVDEKFNFEEVLGNSKSFASGSRFIVTSRDKKVLMRLSEGQSKLYEVQGMDSIRSLQLFCKHAFKKDSPQSGYEDISEAIVSTTGGLPLTLKVIGSLLYQEEEVVWNDKLEQLRKIPEKEVMERLKISYDGLTYEAQQIFIDIACFYIGESKEFPSYMWSDCNFHPEAHKLKVLILGDGLKMSKLPEFPKSGSLEILDIKFSNKEEDLKIEKLRNLKVLRLNRSCEIGKIKGGTIGMMKGLRKLHLPDIVCDYDTFRQIISDIDELSSLEILNVQSRHLVDVLEGIKLPKSLKKLHTSSGFANVEELLDLDEFTIEGSIATTKLAIPPAASSRGGDTTSSTIIPWIHSSKLKLMELYYMKMIIMVESKDIPMLPSSLTKLTIYSVDTERIPNLKNLRNLIELTIEECPNLEEVQGMGGLKSLQVLCIDGAEKLTGIHGLGNLMSCSSCKLTELYIDDCPLLRDVVTFEQQDGDDDGGGSVGERERYVSVQIESLVKMKIKKSPSIDCRSIPRLSKFPMLQFLTIKNIGLNINEESVSQQRQHQQLEGLVDLSISNVDSKRILNLKNLGNLTNLELSECPNLEEIHGMGGLKSLEVLRIVEMEKLTRIHGLGYLMSSSNCKLIKLEIRKCPLLCEAVAFEKQDDDGDGDDEDFLVKMEILEISSIGGRSTPMLSKLPMFKYVKNREFMKGIENPGGISTLSKLMERLGYLRLEDFPALQQIVGAGGFKELWLLMNECFSFEIKDLPYSSLHRVEFDDRRYSVLNSMKYDFDLSSLSTKGGDLGKLRFAITWPHEEISDAESNDESDSDMELEGDRISVV
ncbi:Disease resistance protein L6 [Linum perenne]